MNTTTTDPPGRRRRPLTEAERSERRAIIEQARRVKHAEARLEVHRRAVVKRARAFGISWEDLSRAIGVSVGALHARYARDLADTNGRAKAGKQPTTKKGGTRAKEART